MDQQSLYSKILALCAEMDAVIDLSDKAQAVVNDDQLFLRQISLLFNRVHILEAMKDDAMLTWLESLEQAARSVGCDD